MKKIYTLLLLVLFIGTSAFGLGTGNILQKANSVQNEKFKYECIKNTICLNKEVYKTKEMSASARIRDKKLGVLYMDENERKWSLIEVIDGRIYKGGKLFSSYKTKGFNTIEYDTLFVMDIYGNIYMENVGVRNEANVYHSSMMAGGLISSAGMVKVSSGLIIEINNKSGHYHPNFAMFLQIITELMKRGCIFKNVIVNDEKKINDFRINLQGREMKMYSLEGDEMLKHDTLPKRFLLARQYGICTNRYSSGKIKMIEGKSVEQYGLDYEYLSVKESFKKSASVAVKGLISMIDTNGLLIEFVHGLEVPYKHFRSKGVLQLSPVYFSKTDDLGVFLLIKIITNIYNRDFHTAKYENKYDVQYQINNNDKGFLKLREDLKKLSTKSIEMLSKAMPKDFSIFA